ncbi:MAG: VCBS repeat-containing protein [Deltaproteobacteria bacterium]|nr:VCBS repeat-containing protein [Deltaproteobacteria bacterium]MBK8713486.1 VCBS repeat-containing protein [Deltaproteobacteria bacterium]MBP7288112.1 VCBS repeat-containing protein [Nannocystaceae bacterium]
MQSSGAADADGDEGPRLDLGVPDGPDGPVVCELGEDELDVPPSCMNEAPAGSFDATLEWAWHGHDGDTHAVATALVAQTNDDDGNGQIDLCDTPDVIVLAFGPSAFEADSFFTATGHLYALDGASGQMLWQAGPVSAWGQPALGDLDGDGAIEIVAPTSLVGPLAAWNHDGSPVEGFAEAPLLGSDPVDGCCGMTSAIALADLDHDETPEIVLGTLILDATGHLIGQLDETAPQMAATTVVADLDEDGTTELITAQGVYRYLGDGATQKRFDTGIDVGHPHVADLDGDGDAELLVSHAAGLSVFEHDGTPRIIDARPLGAAEGWGRPAAIHDFDGDDHAQWAMSVGEVFAIFSLAGDEIVIDGQWVVEDFTGEATGTAFDFLGDGAAEAMYGDEKVLWVFDTAMPQAPPLVEQPRSSRTLIEYPTVVDVDNDGSAEIIVISNEDLDGNASSPTVQVYGDADSRWIQARRIWNQHTYHVTNVREDGRIPAVEVPHWRGLNTFRTNAQIEGSATCVPAG